MLLDSVNTIFWDFDGVILDSVPIRDKGYWYALNDYPKEQVEKLLEFQQNNGGLSRYVKFRYFYEVILDQEVTKERINSLAEKYSNYMVKNLIDPNLLIKETMEFIQSYHKKITMHIFSASDQKELWYLCEKLKIKHYFKSIHGSPTPKKKNIDNVLTKNNYNPENIVLIGDSINDYNAANENKIKFLGYNNSNLKDKGEGFITSFKKLKFN